MRIAVTRVLGLALIVEVFAICEVGEPTWWIGILFGLILSGAADVLATSYLNELRDNQEKLCDTLLIVQWQANQANAGVEAMRKPVANLHEAIDQRVKAAMVMPAYDRSSTSWSAISLAAKLTGISVLLDPPKLTIERVIRDLMAHLGVTYRHTEAKAELVRVEKPAAKRTR